jgi:hypothetical protein
MMQEDVTPPTPVPPASQSPYPAHPPKQTTPVDLPVAKKAEATNTPRVGALGATLIGGAVAGAIGLLLAVPLLRRKAQPKASAKGRAKSRSRRKS